MAILMYARVISRARNVSPLQPPRRCPDPGASHWPLHEYDDREQIRFSAKSPNGVVGPARTMQRDPTKRFRGDVKAQASGLTLICTSAAAAQRGKRRTASGSLLTAD